MINQIRRQCTVAVIQGALTFTLNGQLLTRANASADEKFQLLTSWQRAAGLSQGCCEGEMKTCPICAIDLDDAYLFCPDDGSSLGSVSPKPAEPESVSASESDDEPAGAVVLYCPACAAEYPLTFSTCPVHGLTLTRHGIPRLANSGSLPDGFSASAPATVLRFDRDQPRLTKRLTTLELRRPQIERRPETTRRPDIEKRPEIEKPNTVLASESTDIADDLDENVVVSQAQPSHADTRVGGITGYDVQGFLSDSGERSLERPGFRVAAIATVIALTVFGLVATYSLVSNLSRKSRSSSAQIAGNQSSSQPVVVVPTPIEARDYKEEAPAPTSPVPLDQPPAQPAERTRNENPASGLTRDVAPKTPVSQVEQRAPVMTPAASIPATKVSTAPMPALPRGDAGGFDARLIRVRSMKTQTGFRYDLTFNMQEQAGRAANWQRVLVSTRSLSGASHSQAIPFSHRLGATGALTFTISVELTGRSESDWQGRVVCTTLGWDNKGTPLQASFGANVTP
jgi:hypothetical protein